MEIILLESIEGVGRKGAIVKVRDGFGRNHLLPLRKALRVNKDNLFRLQSLQKKFAVEEAKLLSELRGVAQKLESVKIQLTEKATSEGHLFGSVSTGVIARELVAKGFHVTDRQVRMEDTIKAVGTYPVSVRLHADLVVKITVVVDAEGGLPAAEAATATEAETEAKPATEPATDAPAAS